MALGLAVQTRATNGSRKKVHVSSDLATWIEVGEVITMGFTKPSGTGQANSNLDPDFDQSIPVRGGGQTCTFSFNLIDDDEGQKFLEDRADDKVRFYVRICPYWAAGRPKRTGLGYVTSFSGSSPDNQANTGDCSIQITGNFEKTVLLGSDVN